PPDDIFQRWARDIDRELRKEEPLTQKATKLLRWLDTYEVKGSWDDRTLVVVWLTKELSSFFTAKFVGS
ncbi:MAG: hypothetical protein N3B10_15585, partial [Armatimonadetes bacterium]|nr:hypothetical protein [Armatimonadota bacterium]